MTQNSTWKHRKYFDYKDTIKLNLPGYVLPPVVKLEFHIRVPKSWTKKQKLEAHGQYHQSKPDIDNLVKGFLDAFGEDDKHVAVIHAGKYWCVEGEAPCIIIEL